LGKVNYDPFEGWQRLFAAADQLDSNAALIMTLHAALEREMDVLLGKQLLHPEKLRGLGFGQKISVIAASWRGDAHASDLLCAVLTQFNELRNTVAHSDDPKRIKQSLAALRRAHTAIGRRQESVDELINVACDICSFMADGAPTLADFSEAAKAIGDVVTQFSEGFRGAAGASADTKIGASLSSISTSAFGNGDQAAE
jgi:hypothetical protein